MSVFLPTRWTQEDPLRICGTGLASVGPPVCSVSYFNSVDADSPVLWLRALDGNADDYSGNSNDGTMNNGTYLEGIYGASSDAFHFDTSSSPSREYVSVPDDLSYNSTFFSQVWTLEAFVYFDSHTASEFAMRVAEKGDNTHPSSLGEGWGFFSNTSSGIEFRLRMHGDCLGQYKNLVDFNTVGADQTSTWYHVVVKWQLNRFGTTSGSQVKSVAYIDGYDVGAAVTYVGGCTNNSDSGFPLWVGNRQNEASRQHKGRICEFALYKKDLSAARIRQHYIDSCLTSSIWGAETLGSDEVTDGDFSQGATHWTAGTGWTITAASNKATCDGTSGATLTGDISGGDPTSKTFEIRFKTSGTYSGFPSGGLGVYIGSSGLKHRIMTDDEEHVLRITGSGSGAVETVVFKCEGSNGFVGDIFNVQLREIT